MTSLAAVLFSGPTGLKLPALPGDTIGRGARCDLRFSDPYLHELHAAIALRGGDLLLVILQGTGRIEVGGAGDGGEGSRIRLTTGLRVWLSEETSLTVEELVLPDHLPGLSIGGAPPVALLRSSYWICGDRSPGSDLCLVEAGRASPETRRAEVWQEGEDWVWRGAGASAERVGPPGWQVVVDGAVVTYALVPRRDAAPDTLGRPGASRVVVEVGWGITVIRSTDGSPERRIKGTSARILYEMLVLDRPMRWEEMVELVWRDEPPTSPERARHRWDVALGRLREACGMPMLRSDGGMVSLDRRDGVWWILRD